MRCLKHLRLTFKIRCSLFNQFNSLLSYNSNNFDPSSIKTLFWVLGKDNFHKLWRSYKVTTVPVLSRVSKKQCAVVQWYFKPKWCYLDRNRDYSLQLNFASSKVIASVFSWLMVTTLKLRGGCQSRVKNWKWLSFQ